MSRAKKKPNCALEYSSGIRGYICRRCEKHYAIDADQAALGNCDGPKKPKPARVWSIRDGCLVWPDGMSGRNVVGICEELNRLERKIARLEGR